MTRVKKISQVYDQDLAASGLRRASRREYTVANGELTYVSREVIIPADQYTNNLTPWWRQSKKRKSRK